MIGARILVTALLTGTLAVGWKLFGKSTQRMAKSGWYKENDFFHILYIQDSKVAFIEEFESVAENGEQQAVFYWKAHDYRGNSWHTKSGSWSSKGSSLNLEEAKKQVEKAAIELLGHIQYHIKEHTGFDGEEPEEEEELENLPPPIERKSVDTPDGEVIVVKFGESDKDE